ncbi:MAG: hypothetical protein V5B33_08045 [Candidatus Accumulibacter sp. UW20]
MTPHEYSIIGHSRAAIGRYLGTIAGFVATACAIAITFVLGLANSWGFADHIPAILMLPLSAGIIYPLVHWFFDHRAWRHPKVLQFLGVPDLNGDWLCEGTTIDNGEIRFQWTATVTISQTWEKIRVYLNTGFSSSASVSAALLKEPGRGFILMYSYRNAPKIGEKELCSHVGYCELTFNAPADAAEGEYFNNKGRITYGRMKLKRKDLSNGC